MELYFAASLGHEKRSPEIRELIDNRLASFALTSKAYIEFYKQEIRKPHHKMLCDSGAFSVWNKGTFIDINEYIAFCLEHLDDFDYFVNLDVIPARPGQNPTTEQVKEAAAAGWANFRTMCKHLPVERVMHVFHQGEEFKWLERMTRHAKYIGLSPANDKNTSQKAMWLDNCMKYVIDENGFPKVKFHGFAVTSTKLIVRYPWYSVDSATWIRRSSYGDIFVPKFKNGLPDYTRTQEIVSLSERSVIRNKKKNIDHYTYLPPGKRLKIKNYVESLGYDLKVLGVDLGQRLKWNIQFFKEVQKSRPEWPWAMKLQRKGLCI